MPHKRRKKTASGPQPGGPVPNPISHRPTRLLLLTYYKQHKHLTQLINIHSPARSTLIAFTDAILVASLSSDPITLGDSTRDDKLDRSVSMAEVSTRVIVSSWSS